MASTAQSIIDDRRSRQRKAARACELDGIWNASRALEDPPLNVARGFTYPPASKQPKFFVKYTDSESKSLLEHERRNQEFAYNTLRTLQQTASPQRKLLVLAPEIFRAFEHRGYYFLVMEFVPGKTMEGLFREETHETSQGSRATLYRQVADAIRLLSVKAPPGSKPGPVGGGILRHPIFSDFQAVVPYRDVQMLETHLNNVIRIRTRRNPNPPFMTLERELRFYYSDLSGGNFMFETVAGHPVLYIIDFDEAGFLPPSFMTFVLHYTLRCTSVPIAQNIVGLIRPNEENLLAMRTVAYYLATSSQTADTGGKYATGFEFAAMGISALGRSLG